jgi:hypothetical protein
MQACDILGRASRVKHAVPVRKLHQRDIGNNLVAIPSCYGILDVEQTDIIGDDILLPPCSTTSPPRSAKNISRPLPSMDA